MLVNCMAQSEQSNIRVVFNTHTQCTCRDVKARIFGYGVLAVLFSFIGESIPIFSAMSLRNRGLAFSSTDFAIPSGVGGLWLMISATCVYPRVSKALGNKRCVVSGSRVVSCLCRLNEW